MTLGSDYKGVPMKVKFLPHPLGCKLDFTFMVFSFDKIMYNKAEELFEYFKNEYPLFKEFSRIAVEEHFKSLGKLHSLIEILIPDYLKNGEVFIYDHHRYIIRNKRIYKDGELIKDFSSNKYY